MAITLTIGGVHKGGVGKTTAAVTIGHGLALAGYDTLIVDLDAQGHVAYYLGLERGPGLYQVLKEGRAVRKCAVGARPPNLKILASDQTTADIEEHLIVARLGELRLSKALAPLKKRGPRFIILDTAPGAGILHDAAMLASDYVLAVAEASTAALDGLALLTETVASFQEDGGKASILGVIPVMVDDRTLASRKAIKALQETADIIGPTYPVIHRATIFQQSVSEGKTLWEMDPENKTRAAAEYTAVIKRLLKDLRQ